MHASAEGNFSCTNQDLHYVYTAQEGLHVQNFGESCRVGYHWSWIDLGGLETEVEKELQVRGTEGEEGSFGEEGIV